MCQTVTACGGDYFCESNQFKSRYDLESFWIEESGQGSKFWIAGKISEQVEHRVIRVTNFISQAKETYT